MSHEVTLVPGDHADLFELVRPLLSAIGVEISFDEPSESATVDSMLTSARRTGCILMGAQYGNRDAGELPPVVRLRKQLGCYANVRPIRSLQGLPSRYDDLDIVVVRETTEDIYAHMEHESIPDVFESVKVTTAAACERIARHAFELARAQGRKKVTIVHKANIMKLSDGMFLRVGREVAQDYPDIECNDVIVDALCMLLVLRPSQFDVLVTGNLFGDIISDLCAGLVGGAGNAPSINVADDVALFTAGHQSDSADRNPLTLLVPVISMLTHLGEVEAAETLRRATEAALQAGELPTEVGGALSAKAFIGAVTSRL